MKWDDQKKRIFARDHWRCKRCGKMDDLQRAHGIAETISNKKMVKRLWFKLFQEEITESQALQIINSDENISTSCSTCNSYFNIGNNPEKVKSFLREYNVNHTN
jgi:hypothetical protein